MRTDVAPPLADALRSAGFTVDGVRALVGEQAHQALERNETTPGLRATGDGSPLASLTRLFLLQSPVTREAAERALPGLVDRLCATGLLEQSVSEVAARLDCRPYADDDHDLWVVSDLTPGLDGAPVRVRGDYVLGVSPASTSLARMTVRDPVERALDLGTGCGVQALHLAGHAGRVVATDVNPRALAMTRFNAALNGVEVDVRDGSLLDPVRGERFDLVATNPPFVISPASGERLVYRDSGLPGDQVVERIVRGLPAHLTVGGWGQVLADWIVRDDAPWDERVAEWLDPSCDALVVQREVLDPAAYVELWLKDSGHHGGPDYAVRYDTWLSWFEEQRVAGIGFGWINLRAGGPGHLGRHELLDWPFEVEQPIAPAVAAWGRAVAAGMEPGPEDRLVVAHGVRQETQGEPGAEHPATILLRQQRGLRRARQVDTAEAAVVGACDGDLAVGQILDAAAVLLEEDPAELRARLLPVLGSLVREGYLVRAD